MSTQNPSVPHMRPTSFHTVPHACVSHPYNPGHVRHAPAAGASGAVPPAAVLGIDPGFSGAMAWLDLGGDLHVEDMPTLAVERNGKTKRDMDLAVLVDLVERHRPAFAVVERVGAMPGQGVSSMFAFGKGFGSILGVLAALRVPVELVTPAIWKRTLAVPPGKDGARLRASQLLPAHGGNWRRAKDDGRAEASMLAWYGLAYLSNRPSFALGQAQDSTNAGTHTPTQPATQTRVYGLLMAIATYA
jgi:crossover junction endodeoxyribonuclease RuvC